jgi:hypothetical protein
MIQTRHDEHNLSAPMMVSLLDGVVARGHTFRFRAGGSSMFPFIRDGDVVSIKPLDHYRVPRLGDVLAFNRNPDEASAAHLVVHRLVGRSAQGGYMLRGDHHPPGHSDGMISPVALLGIVTGVERCGRTVRLGLGPERALIAFLSRLGLLWRLIRLFIYLYRLRLLFHA